MRSLSVSTSDHEPRPDVNEKPAGDSSNEVPSSTDQSTSESADVGTQKTGSQANLIVPEVSIL